MDSVELFRSADLLVRAVAGSPPDAPGDTLVVTFNSYTDDFNLERDGFGQHFFRSRAVDAMHVINRTNAWYQYPELPEALAAIRDRASSYRRVLTYGSSMGGYAALRFAAALGADTAVAIAPQYSVDPRVMPDEYRWFEAHGIDFCLERCRPIATGPNPGPIPRRAILFFDPLEPLDRAHVGRIARELPVIQVAIPHSGHVCSVYLTELGMLTEALEAILADRLDAPAFVHAARARRRDSAKYFAVLSGRCGSRHPDWAIALARRAVALRPGDAGHLHNLAERLAETGAFAEAVEWEQQAARLEPGITLFPKMQALFLLRQRRFAESRAVLGGLIERHPDVADYHHLVAAAFGSEGRIADAVAAERRAVALDPAHPHYRRDLERLERDLERPAAAAAPTPPPPELQPMSAPGPDHVAAGRLRTVVERLGRRRRHAPPST